MHLEALTRVFFEHRYFTIYVVTAIEGPLTELISGIMLRLGVVAFWPIYMTVMAADLTGDVVWYWLGRSGGNRFIHKYGKYLSITPELVNRVKRLFRKHGTKILIISKLTMGFGFIIPIFIVAGITKMPFKKYMIINIAEEFVWAGGLILVGYSFGSTVSRINTGLELISSFAAVIVLYAILKGILRYIRHRKLAIE